MPTTKSDYPESCEYSSLSAALPLFFWQEYAPKVNYLCACSAIVTAAGLVLIDPLPLSQQSLSALLQEAGATPVAIVLTNANHQRHSMLLSKQLSIPIYAPVGSEEALQADYWYKPQQENSHDEVSGLTSLALDCISLPGFAVGETAVYTKDILILGDALIHAEEQLLLLPKKYCMNPTLAKKSLLDLKKCSPKILLTAHGFPMMRQTAQRLKLFLEGIE